MTAPETADNPLLAPWDTPEAAPPFAQIRPEHFAPAYAQAFAEHKAEIAAIAGRSGPPDFDNTIVALEQSGRALERVEHVFHLLAGADSNDALLEIEREMSPQIASHWNAIKTNADLFRRIDALARKADSLALNPEQKRVLERYHTSFRRAGAALDPAQRGRLAEIIERLAMLGTAFSQNVLADEQAFTLPLDGEAELAGLPGFHARGAARGGAGTRARRPCGDAVALERRAVPAIRAAPRPAREGVRGFVQRGDNGGPTDNKAIIAEMVRLRAERARLLGYADFAHYRLDDAMAKTPGAVRTLLDTVWTPARARALKPTATPAGADAGRRRQLRARAVGLALLRREAAAAALRRSTKPRSSPISTSTA